MALLTLRGTPFLYYGDELGMTDVPVAPSDARDTVGLRLSPDAGRDPCRTPMQWSGAAGGGFTLADVRPWLPIGDAAAVNVDDQRVDPTSMLHLCRDLIALRRSTPELRSGGYDSLPSPSGVWAWRRGDAIAVALNLTDEPSAVTLGPSRILIATDRARDGEGVRTDLSLGPWQGAVVRLED
jgi:alpha-glucosidase